MAKAGRPKKDSAKLPDWFDIEKYRQIKSYGAAEWFQQLVFRSIIHECYLPNKPQSFGKECLTLLYADPHVTLPRLYSVYPVTNTYVTSAKEYTSRGGYIDILIREMTLDPYLDYGVRAVSNADMADAYFFLPHSAQILWGKTKAKVNKAETLKAQLAWLQEGQDPYKGDALGHNKFRKYVRVDLSLPHAILKRSFAEYLKGQEKETEEIKSPFLKNQDFAVWYNSGVLPYLDLRLWEIESGKTFRWSAFVDALNLIADKPVGSEDSCRKTAKALADKLMDYSTIRILNSQAVKEQAEGHKKSGKLFVR